MTTVHEIRLKIVDGSTIYAIVYDAKQVLKLIVRYADRGPMEFDKDTLAVFKELGL